MNSLRLLVSVRSEAEARLAISGGCDVLDVKEPARGSLGMADPAVIAAILAARDALAPALLVSVALGDVVEWEQRRAADIEGRETLSPLQEARAGSVAYLKLGTAALGDDPRWPERFRRTRDLIERALPSAPAPPLWIAVAYADCQAARAPAPGDVIAAAEATGCRGVLVDTWSKTGGGLLDWLSPGELAALANEAHRAGCLFALAGRLTIAAAPILRAIQPDIVGIRSAACRGNERTAPLDPQAVRAFRDQLSGRAGSSVRKVEPIPQASDHRPCRADSSSGAAACNLPRDQPK